ncbi:MAG: alpha/beta fold hydrolase [Alphaproteobacteria bacterium]
MTNPIQQAFHATGFSLNYYEWGQPNQAPTVLLFHATGFHARCWDKVIAALPDRHIIAVDTPGHGLSSHNGPFDSWAEIGAPLKEFVAALPHTHMVGAGHSMGGHCMVQVAAEQPNAFRHMVLIDPVIPRPEAYDPKRWGIEMPTPADHPVARRRNVWRDWQDMFAHFESRNPYSLWRADVLEDYCRYGVVPNPDGDSYVLACPPVVEASVYLGKRPMELYDHLASITVPVDVLRAKMPDRDKLKMMDFSTSPTWENLAQQFPQGRDHYMPELTHFIPMQDPGRVARFIEGAASSR